MPSYPHLFANGDIRGEALVAFLCSLGSDTSDRRAQQIGVWEPALNAQPDRKSAPVLYRADCAACHGEQGGGDGPMAQVFGGKSKCQLQPTALSPANGGNPFSTLPRIIKFGIPGTQMPGYETLTDSEVLGLTHYITSLRQKGNTHENSDR